MPELRETPHVLEYPYTRSTGPVMGPFLTGIRDGRILANRGGGKVLCPPLEYDPETGATLEPDFVEVGPGGVIVSSTWIAEPNRKHPIDRPFAFALIQLDGADTPLLHAVDAGTPERAAPGSRVAAQYRDERVGAITDLYFVPEAEAKAQTIEPGAEPVIVMTHLISLLIDEPLFPHRRRFANGLLRGEIIGQKSPVTGKVYVPGRGYDLMERVPITEADEVVVADKGTVSSFTVITPVQYYGQKETKPYIRCSILLDGADSPIIGVDVRDIEEADFRVGLRLQAVWKSDADRVIDEIDNRGGFDWSQVVERWEPTGEPDREIDNSGW
jgi:uncharacterized protein